MRKPISVVNWDAIDKMGGLVRKGSNEFNMSAMNAALGAVQHFSNIVTSPDFERKASKAAALGSDGRAQFFNNASDFPATVLNVVEKFQNLDYFDNAWQELFPVRDYTGTERKGFEIATLTDYIAWEETPEGAKAKTYKLDGTKTQVYFDRYSSGLNWSRTMMEDREYVEMEEMIGAMLNAYNAKRASTHYALIEALTTGNNVAWQAAPGSIADTNDNYQAYRDIRTMNKAAEAILLACKDKGYGVGPNTRMVALAPIQLRDRLDRAQTLLNANVAGNFIGVRYNIDVFYTVGGFTTTTDYYIGLPGQKLRSGTRQNLLLTPPTTDWSTYSDTIYGWSRWGAAIADTDQLRRCKTS